MTPAETRQQLWNEITETVWVVPHAYYSAIGRALDAHEAALTAERQPGELAQEVADWKLAFEASNEHVGKLDADLTRLREGLAALEEVIPEHIASRLRALREGH
jgi:hypothetical protein